MSIDHHLLSTVLLYGGKHNGRLFDPLIASAAIHDGLVKPHPRVEDLEMAMVLGAYNNPTGHWWVDSSVIAERILNGIHPAQRTQAVEEVARFLAEDIIEESNDLAEAEPRIRYGHDVIKYGQVFNNWHQLLAWFGFPNHRFDYSPDLDEWLNGMIEDRVLHIAGDESMFLAEHPASDYWFIQLLDYLGTGILTHD